jgi:hypothetical protein
LTGVWGNTVIGHALHFISSTREHEREHKAFGIFKSTTSPTLYHWKCPDYTHLVMADRDCTFFWLLPANEAALRIVQDTANSRFQDNVPIEPRQTPATDEKRTLDCLRIGFDYKRVEDSLVSFGQEPLSSDIVLRGGYDPSHKQALLYIHPTSKDLICRDTSSYRTTILLFSADCGPVGRWAAVDHDLIEQAVLRSSNAVLAFCGALFTFRWYPPFEENTIRAAKEAFLKRKISPSRQRTELPPWGEVDDLERLSTKCPAQYNYQPSISPLALLKLPSDIRYMIFRLAIGPGSIQPTMISPISLKNNTEKLYTVHGCIDLLNRSHQLLNPLYSSHDLATEAADVFYSQNVFDLNILQFNSFAWTVKHMPSLAPFDPLTAISHLRLWLRADASLAFTPHDDTRWLRTQRVALGDASNPVAHEWSDAEKEELRGACAAVTTLLPGLRDIELHLWKESMCYLLEEPRPDADVSLHIFKIITHTIKKWVGQGGRSTRVFLHGRRFREWPDNLRRTTSYGEDMMEDITAWWHEQADKAGDEELACGENREWLGSVTWEQNWKEADWKRKGGIEAAIMRLRVAEWVGKDGDG